MQPSLSVEYNIIPGAYPEKNSTGSCIEGITTTGLRDLIYDNWSTDSWSTDTWSTMIVLAEIDVEVMIRILYQ